MYKTDPETLEKSLMWIRANLNATNLDVPTELIREWIFEDNDDDPKPGGFFFAVFTFGYMQSDLHTGPSPGSEPRSVPLSLLLELFNVWQLKLSLAEIHRRTPICVDPMPLFRFPKGEEVRYWPHEPRSAPH
jgi:hypothetical protein